MLHSQRVTVWWGFWDEGIIGPFFSENAPGQALIVNGVHYRDEMIFFVKIARYWFRRHVISIRRSHIPYSPSRFLVVYFPVLAITIGHPANVVLRRWTFSLGFFEVKGRYQKADDNPCLGVEIERYINEIQHLCKTVMGNFDKRVYVYEQTNLTNMLFHK